MTSGGGGGGVWRPPCWVTEHLVGEGAPWPPPALGGPPYPLDFAPLLWYMPMVGWDWELTADERAGCSAAEALTSAVLVA